MAGWTVTASGNAEDPAHHKNLLARLAELLREDVFGTGSSSFTSAHVSDTNFHVTPAAEPVESEGQAAGSPPVAGEGGQAEQDNTPPA